MRPSERPDALDQLVLHLQAADLTVAIDTVLRLRVLFGSEGLPDEPERVANMVAAVVAHQPREVEAARRATLAWLQQAPAPRPGPAAEPTPIATPVEAARAEARGGRTAAILITAVLLIAGGALVWFSLTREPLHDALKAIGTWVEEPEAPVTGVPFSMPSAAPATDVQFLERAPVLQVRTEPARPPKRSTWPFWALACFGAGIASYGWRRTRPPGEPTPPPGPDAPPRRHRRPTSRTPRFVTGHDADVLAWGIDRFISDEATARLDLEQTVRATVRAGGAPDLHWARAKQHREIWLWIDDAAVRAHPEIEQLVSEVQIALARVGLEPRVAHFWGIPDTLSEGDAPVRIDQLEDARQLARVAVLTDGRLWTRWRSEPARRREAEAALRRLSGWRQLAVVDFGDGEWPIAEHLERHAIEQRAPAELIGWLGEFDVRVPDTAEDDRIAWAAACALSPEPVTEDDALALLAALAPAGVDASPWAIRDLRAEAPGPGRRLRWTTSQRAALLSWLAEAEAGAESLLGRARRFWRTRILGDDPRAVAQRAWLDLFDLPADGGGPVEKAIATLLPLTHADDDGHMPVAVGDRVRQALPADLARPGAIRLPWRWADLDLHSRLRARAIGLGRAVGGLPEETVVRPGRVGLAAGLGAGVALAALTLALWPEDDVIMTGPPVVVENPVEARINGPHRGENGFYWLHASTDWGEVTSVALSPAAHVSIGTVDENCEERLTPDVMVLLCGTEPRPRRIPRTTVDPMAGPPKLVAAAAVIQADPDEQRWRRLAARLLDTGSVDAVVVAPAAESMQRGLGHVRFVHDGPVETFVLRAGKDAGVSQVQYGALGVGAVAWGDGSANAWDALAEGIGYGEPIAIRRAFPSLEGEAKIQVRGPKDTACICVAQHQVAVRIECTEAVRQPGIANDQAGTRLLRKAWQSERSQAADARTLGADAARHILCALETKPDNHRLLGNLVAAYEVAGDRQAALRAYARLERASPPANSLAAAAYNLARLDCKAGDWKAALAHLDDALRHKPEGKGVSDRRAMRDQIARGCVGTPSTVSDSLKLPWEQQLEADKIVVGNALLGNDFKRPYGDTETVLGALIRVPDALIWRGQVPVVWALVRARTAPEFDAAIQARIDLIDSVLERASAADRALAKSYLQALRKHPDLVNLWTGRSTMSAAALSLDRSLVSAHQRLEAAIKARLSGWRRTELRRLAKDLYAANQRVIGDFPFGRSEDDASQPNVEALLRAISAIRVIPLKNPFASDAGEFLASFGKASDRRRREWATAWTEFVAVHEVLNRGQWPMPVRWPEGKSPVMLLGKGGKLGRTWASSDTWSPGQQVRFCVDKNDCTTGTGTWGLLRLIDTLSAPNLRGTSGRNAGGECVRGRLEGDRCVGWVQVGASDRDFVPKAIDLLPIQDSPGVPTVERKGSCAASCQAVGWPVGDAVGASCLCGE